MGKIIDRVRRREARKGPPIRISDLSRQPLKLDLGGPPMVRVFIGRSGEPEREVNGATMAELVANTYASTRLHDAQK